MRVPLPWKDARTGSGFWIPPLLLSPSLSTFGTLQTEGWKTRSRRAALCQNLKRSSFFTFLPIWKICYGPSPLSCSVWLYEAGQFHFQYCASDSQTFFLGGLHRVLIGRLMRATVSHHLTQCLLVTSSFTKCHNETEIGNCEGKTMLRLFSCLFFPSLQTKG